VCFRARHLAGVLLLLWAAACQPVPQPFAPASKQAPFAAAVEVSPRAGLVVDRIGGIADDDRATAMRRQLVQALQDRDVVASLQLGHRLSYWLQGDLRLEPAVDGGDGSRIVTGSWVLLRPDGSVQDEFTHRSVIATGDSGQPSAAALSQVAVDAARAIEAAVARWEVHDGRRLALPPLAIGAIDGAPSDGREALTAALMQALGKAGIEIRDRPEGAEYLLLGAIARQPRPFGRERIDIAWQVIRHDGSELGRIEQNNELPRGRLERRWGLLAEEIAGNAAVGVVALLQRADEAGNGQ